MNDYRRMLVHYWPGMSAGLLPTSTKYSLGGEILRGCVGAVIGKFQGGKLNSHSQVFRPLPRLDRCSQWNSFLLLKLQNNI